MSNKTLCISCCGGGALGIGPLAFMCKIEQELGKKISDVSFAYSGTSTGAIIAAGLAEGYSAHDLFDLYRSNLSKIFTKYSWYKRIQPTCPTYDNSNLIKILKNKFDGKIGSWKKPIFIPTTCMNGETGKSVEKIWDLGDKDIDKWFAILTSTAAPTYFDCVYDKDGKCYIDGGMWKNSPIDVLNAGLMKSGWSNYKILNLDTGMTTPNKDAGNKTLAGWATYLINNWIARTSYSGVYETKSIIGDENVYHASPVHDKKIDMDKVDDKTINKIIEIWEKYFYDNKKEIMNFIKG